MLVNITFRKSRCALLHRGSQATTDKEYAVNIVTWTNENIQELEKDSPNLTQLVIKNMIN